MRYLVALLLLASTAAGQEILGARSWSTVDGKVVEIDGVRCRPFTLNPAKKVEPPKPDQAIQPIRQGRWELRRVCRGTYCTNEMVWVVNDR